jgi:hypothetical protein
MKLRELRDWCVLMESEGAGDADVVVNDGMSDIQMLQPWHLIQPDLSEDVVINLIAEEG